MSTMFLRSNIKAKRRRSTPHCLPRLRVQRNNKIIITNHMSNKPYKTMCDTCHIKTWYETSQRCHAMVWPNDICKECGRDNHENNLSYRQQVRCSGTLQLISNENLNPLLHSFYDSGERVEIKTKYKTTERFYVGKTTGWMPMYIKLSNTRSNSGPVVGKDEIISVKGLNKYRC